MQPFIYLYLFISAVLLSLILVPLAKKIALRYDILDQPGERKVHVNAKPYLGGVAIFFAFMIVILGNLAAAWLLSDHQIMEPFRFQLHRLQETGMRLAVLLATSSGLVILGVIDDIKGVTFSAKWKLLVQVLCALIVVAAGVRISFLSEPALNWIFSVFWIVGITNSFNLLDNMDGLSSGVAAISGFTFFAVTAVQGQVLVAMMLITLVGSILGFLKYNYNPSSIFMGDAGSLFLGFLLGCLTISASYVTTESTSLLPALMPLIILSVPLFDTISVVIIRIKEKRPVYVGDKRHLSHRLVDMGFSHRNAVNTIYLITFAIGLIAFLLPGLNVWQSIVLFSQVIIILIIISILMFVGRRTSQRQE